MSPSVITSVLLATALLAVVLAAPSPSNTIVQNAQQVPALSTLVTVLTTPAYAPILNLLSNPGTFTVFAPSNDAFTAAGLDLKNVAYVTDILMYHVLSVKAYSNNLTAINFPASLLKDSAVVYRGGAGQVVEIFKSGSTVTISFGIPGAAATTATVTMADVLCSNGVVHVIDKVLIYPAKTSVVATSAALSSLVSAVVAAQLVSAIDLTASITVFAPTDAAFLAAGIDPSTMSLALLATVLKYHVVPAVAFSSQLTNGQVLATLEGSSVTVGVTGAGVTVNGANVVVANVLTANGVVHVIDKVLLPTKPTNTIVQNAQLVPELSTLVSVLSRPAYAPILNLLSGRGTFTVFAPSNAAFASANLNVSDVSLVTDTLQYHVLPVVVYSNNLTALNFPSSLLTDPAVVYRGGAAQQLEITSSGGVVQIIFGVPGVAATTATVTTANVLCSNGVVHIIDKVLSFPAKTSVVAGAGGLSSLVQALKAGSLVPTVDTTASLTVFAPTDAAFKAYGISISAIPAAVLQNILKYHVVSGVAFSNQLSNNQQLTTVQGSKLTVSVSSGNVMINNAKVLIPNILTANGVVHVIDTVLLPPTNPSSSIVANAFLVPELSALVSVLALPAYSSILTALDSAGTFTVFAPTTAAFAAAALNVSNVELVSDTLKYHVLGTEVLSKDLLALNFPTSILTDPAVVFRGGAGQQLEVTKTGSTVQIVFGAPAKTATVLVADLPNSNGYVHIIDTVLSYPAKTSTVASKSGLNSLVSALTFAALVSVVDTTSSLTVFAPTDAAFATYGIDLNNVPLAVLQNILKYHVVAAVAFSNQLTNGQRITTLQGATLTVTIGSGVMINNANVVTANVITANGVVHVIDQVLLPPTNPSSSILANAFLLPSLSTLVNVISLAPFAPVRNLLSASGNYTLFAPTNAAFAAAGLNPANVALVVNTLQYHVLGVRVLSKDLPPLSFPNSILTNPDVVFRGGAGQNVEVSKTGTSVRIIFGVGQSADVTVADIGNSNGVVHIIDKVLSFPANVSTVATTANLTKLVGAVVSANLLSTIDTTASLTVFAPTDAAFAAYGIDLTKLPASVIQNILKYHVVSGVQFSTMLTNGQQLSSLQGSALKVTVTGGTVQINGATVVVANVLTANGVVHVIDTVLLPPLSSFNSIIGNAALVPQLSTLVTVLTLPAYAPVLKVLSGPGPFTVFAPTNAAFTAAGVNPANVPFVTDTLEYHVLSGAIYSNNLTSVQFPSSLLTDANVVYLNGKGQLLHITRSGNTVQIVFGLPNVAATTATVTTANVQNANGVVHIIDKVLLYPSSTSVVAQSAGLTTLLNAAVLSALTTVINTSPAITVFAPTNAAFAAANINVTQVSQAALVNTLKGHVVGSGEVFSTQLQPGQTYTTLGNTVLTISQKAGRFLVNQANITVANVLTANGVVHVIDAVLAPGLPTSAASALSPSVLLTVGVATLLALFLQL